MNPAELVYGKYLPKWRDRNDQWAESSCPFPDHNDKNPSFGFHKIEGTYNCLGCNRKGNSVNFVAEMEGISVVEARKRVLDTGFDLDQTGVVERQGRAALNPQRSAPAEMPKETIDYAEICKHHAELLKDTNAMEYLTHERKWSLEKIVELKIGLMHHGQISIPLLEGTAVLNRKRFKKLGKKYAEKGSTTKYFYPRNLFGEDKILIVGGEPDAIAGQSVGLPTISSFGGEGVVPLDADLILLSGKEIGILYDNDTAGRRGAQVIAKKLSRVSHNVKILNISDICDGAKSGYDLTDFISDHRDPEEILKLWDESSHYTDSIKENPARVVQVAAEAAHCVRYLGATVSVSAKLLAVSADAYSVCQEATVSCEDIGSKKACQGCPMAIETVSWIADPLKQDVIGQVNTPTYAISKMIKASVGARCNSAIVEKEASRSAVEIMFTSVSGVEAKMRGVLFLRDGEPRPRVPGVYEFQGTVVSDPKTNALTFMLWEYRSDLSQIDTWGASRDLALLSASMQFWASKE